MADDAVNRRWDLDAIRGLLLVLMTLTHLPTRFAGPTSQPFGFVSAAEGFVMLSGFMAGMVYGAKALRHGDDAMQQAFIKRAAKIYLCQAALLLFAFTVIAAIGLFARQDAISNLLAFYLERPIAAFFSGLLLIYNPALLDILPMYILFMLISPLVLLQGIHRGWAGVLLLSVGLWFAAQFDLGQWLFNHLGLALKLPVNYREMGAFHVLGWQFLWVLGLWMGATLGQPATAPTRFPAWLVGTAVALAAVGFVWRHAIGQSPFPGQAGLNLMFDKWHLGPLRLINFFALLVLVMHFGPWLKTHLPRAKVLETLGQASLPVFCAHLVLALSALALFGAADKAPRPWAIDVLILVASLMALYLVALISRLLDQRSTALRARLKARRTRAGTAVPIDANTDALKA